MHIDNLKIRYLLKRCNNGKTKIYYVKNSDNTVSQYKLSECQTVTVDIKGDFTYDVLMDIINELNTNDDRIQIIGFDIGSNVTNFDIDLDPNNDIFSIFSYSKLKNIQFPIQFKNLASTNGDLIFIDLSECSQLPECVFPDDVPEEYLEELLLFTTNGIIIVPDNLYDDAITTSSFRYLKHMVFPSSMYIRPKNGGRADVTEIIVPNKVKILNRFSIECRNVNKIVLNGFYPGEIIVDFDAIKMLKEIVINDSTDIWYFTFNTCNLNQNDLTITVPDELFDDYVREYPGLEQYRITFVKASER